jgi:hypothetical protein
MIRYASQVAYTSLVQAICEVERPCEGLSDASQILSRGFWIELEDHLDLFPSAANTSLLNVNGNGVFLA